MAKRITVTALQPVHHDGRSHVPGSVFTTTPIDAASLKYRGKVKLGGQLSGATVPEHPSITRRMEPVEGFKAAAPQPPETPKPPPQTEDVVEQAPPAAPTPEHEPPQGRRRGRAYQRRDMVAEPPTGISGE